MKRPRINSNYKKIASCMKNGNVVIVPYTNSVDNGADKTAIRTRVNVIKTDTVCQ